MEKNKKAKWKSREEHNDYIHAECSGCGFQVESYDAVETGRSSTDYIKAKWKFCPKCGAEMTVQNKQKGASLRPGQGYTGLLEKMEIRPITFKKASEYINQHHRHHRATVGCKFCIGLYDGELLIGCAVCGRPVSRYLDDGLTCEINRL